MTGADLEGVDNLDDALDKEVDGQQEGEGSQSGEWVKDEVAAGEEIECAEKKLPENGPGGVGLKGHDEVGDSSDDDGPADKERDGDSRDGGDEDGEEAGQKKKNAKGDGPVDGSSGDGAEGSGADHVHEGQSSERCRYKRL